MAKHLSLTDLNTLLDDTITTAASTVVTAASNATPVVVTSAAHGLVTNDWVLIAGVGGNTNANGIYKITKVDANSFSLNSRAGNSNYTSGGTAAKVTVANQLRDLKPADLDSIADALNRMKVVRGNDRVGGSVESALKDIIVQQP